MRRTPVGIAIAFAIVVTVSCGKDDHPPLLDDFEYDAGPDTSTQFTDAGNPRPECEKAADGGPCGCLEMSFLSDVPNLYFVLDRSGSMVDKWQTVRTVVSQTITKLGPRAKFGAAVFPGLGAGDGCQAGTEIMAPRQGDSPAGTAGPTTYGFIGATSGIAPDGGTPTAATLRALASRLSSLPGRTFVVLATDGGPNCNENAVCGVDACIPNIESIQSCQPNTPPNCCASGAAFGPTQCLDTPATVQAVSALAAANIPTFVIGVPGSAPYASVLDAVADAGGTARATAPKYYRVDTNDAAALSSALAQVAAKITATCTLTLSPPPADPSKINVYFDDTVVPPDPANGWTFDGTTVHLVGTACSRVLSGEVLNLRVIGGCPTVPPK